MMRTLPLTLALLMAAPALAKPWKGIEPGSSTKEEVIKAFGTPTRVIKSNGKEVLAYHEKEIIKGTTQVQFRVDPETGQVERIDIFPGPVIDKEAVESTYGPACASPTPQAEPCYQKKITDEFKTYFQYGQIGVVVFFNDDGKTVQSFVYTPQTKAPAAAPAKGRAAKSPKQQP